MPIDEFGLDRGKFLKCHCLNEEQFQATGLDWSVLEAIWAKHASTIPELQATAEYVSQRLRELPAVHSLKVRIKHPEHVIAKIIRKKQEICDFDVSLETYSEHITDLIGIRALHLFKDQWQFIHEFVKTTWELHEAPIAYVRAGDPEAVLRAFSDSGCTMQEHPFGYRSVHYLIKSQPTKQLYVTELQVRTLFEEGWSEIDHQIRYPNLSDNPHLASFLTIFNRVAGRADEMGSFVKTLSRYLNDQLSRFVQIETQLQTNEAELKKAIAALDISQKEKQDLALRVQELREVSHRQAAERLLVQGKTVHPGA